MKRWYLFYTTKATPQFLQQAIEESVIEKIHQDGGEFWPCAFEQGARDNREEQSRRARGFLQGHSLPSRETKGHRLCGEE